MRARDAWPSRTTVVASLDTVGFYEAHDFECVAAIHASSGGDPEIPTVEMEKRL